MPLPKLSLALLCLACAFTSAKADDWNEKAAQIFAKTCGTRPDSGHNIETVADQLGFKGGAVGGVSGVLGSYAWKFDDGTNKGSLDLWNPGFGPNNRHCSLIIGNLEPERFVMLLEADLSLHNVPNKIVIQSPATYSKIWQPDGTKTKPVLNFLSNRHGNSWSGMLSLDYPGKN